MLKQEAGSAQAVRCCCHAKQRQVEGTRPPQQPRPTSGVARRHPDPCPPQPLAVAGTESALAFRCGTAWQPAGLLHSWGQRSLPCLGLTRRAGPAGPSPGERTRRAVRGALAYGWGQPRKMGPCVPTRTLHPSTGHAGVTRVPIPRGLPGPAHLQVRPGLAQHIVGPGHCQRERNGVSEVAVLWSQPRRMGTRPAWPCHHAAGYHAGHLRWLTMNRSMLSLSWAVLRSCLAVLCRASSLSESCTRSAAISPCSSCSWDKASVISCEHDLHPLSSPQPRAHLALLLGRADGQHGAPEGSEEGRALLQDTVQGAGAAPEVPCAHPPQGLREKGAGAGAAGAPASRCAQGPSAPSPARQGSAGSSPQAGGYLPLASPASLRAGTGLRRRFTQRPQRGWSPATASPVLPALYLLSRERAVGQPERWAREAHQLMGQRLPLQDVPLQGPVGVQVADDVRPRWSLSPAHQRICSAWL